MAFWEPCKQCGRALWSIIDDLENKICGKCSGNDEPFVWDDKLKKNVKKSLSSNGRK